MKNKRLNLGFYLCFVLATSLLLGCGNKDSAVTQNATPETLVSVEIAVVEASAAEGQASNGDETGNDAIANPTVDGSEAVDSDSDDYGEDCSGEQGDENDEDMPGFVRCQAKVEIAGKLYDSQSIGPTLEEARDNAVDEACAISCSDKLAKFKGDENKLEAAIEDCVEKCGDKTIVVAAACTIDGESIYTEGAWSDTNDATPTNGEESTAVVDE